MAAEKIDPANLERTELPQPAWVAPRAQATLRVGIRQFMGVVVYCAVVAMLGRYLYEDESPARIAAFGVLVGFGLAFVGVWGAGRLGSYAFFGWVLIVIGVMVATATVLGPLAIIGLPILIGVSVFIQTQGRRSEQAGLLWVLAVAAERSIPLAPGVEAYAQHARGAYRRRAHTLAALLLRGQSLGAALDWVPRVVPWDAPLLARAGELVGRLAAGLKEATTIRAQRHQGLRDVAGRVGYILVVLTAAQAIAGFLLYFIIPKFEAIFKDFGVDLPGPTQGLILVSHWVVGFSPAISLFELGIGVCLLLALGGRGLQRFPLVGRLFRVQHKALVLRTLAIVIDGGGKLDQGFALMAESYPSGRVRKQIRRAAATSRTGASWTEALRWVGLISWADVGVLDAASRAGNLPWALRTMAEAGERRSAYRLQIGSHLAFVATLIGLGALVLAITVALFLPLVTLIERLAG